MFKGQHFSCKDNNEQDLLVKHECPMTAIPPPKKKKKT